MGISDDFADFDSIRRRGPSKGYATGPSGGPPCPTCGSRNSAVVDSRPFDGGQRRRRRCMQTDKCERWNTYETNVDPATLTKPELSKLDKSRVLRIIETADALRKSLDIPK